MEALRKVLDYVKKNALNVALIVVGACAVMYLLRRVMMNENFDSYKEEIKKLAREADIAKDKYDMQDVSQEDIVEQKMDVEKEVEDSNKLVEDKDVKPEDLLPGNDEADEWAAVNPKGKGSLELKNVLEAGHHIGVDTQANSLRNANQQIRSEPPNPQKPVSIFLNSTISPDPFRKPLEIGGDY
jgi:hypothetical protein